MKTLSTMASSEVADSECAAVFLVPVGSTEQHGPHLPLGTDTTVALELCRRASAKRSDVVVGPAVAYGSSGEHEGFPGTVSIGREALEHVLVELGRSASRSFGAIVFVSGHGGNAVPLHEALRLLRSEGHPVSVFSPRFEGGDAHAGRTETSLMLAIDPSSVALERAEPGATEPLGELMPALMKGGVRAVSRNGVLGDPIGASRTEGLVLLEEASDQLSAHLHHIAGLKARQ